MISFIYIKIDENIVKKIQTLRLNITDFEVVKPLAQGAIGKVRINKLFINYFP